MTTSQSCDSTSCLNKSRSFTTVVVEKMSKQPLDTRIRKKKMKNQVAPGLILPGTLQKEARHVVSLLSNLEIFQLSHLSFALFHQLQSHHFQVMPCPASSKLEEAPGPSTYSSQQIVFPEKISQKKRHEMAVSSSSYHCLFSS